MTMTKLTIGNLAAHTGTKVQTIRYYEDMGLMKPYARTEGGHRIYSVEDRQRLTFIRHARELGFPLEAIRDLLRLTDNPDMSCKAVDHIAQKQLDEVELRLTKLTALREELQRMIAECRHDRVCDCRIIKVLSDHRHCVGSIKPS